ncbi:MAG: hypothetical protein ACOCZS_04965 [Verrucomicrobiota bacterium]
MKKKNIALGCLGIVSLVIIVAGLMVYSFIYKPISRGWDSLKEINQINAEIDNRDTYNPPADGKLAEEQVTRFVSVQKELNSHLEEVLQKLQVQYQDVGDKWQEGDISIQERIAVLNDILQLYADAKGTQVEALNNEDFSLAEYRFVRQAFYRALEVKLIPYDFDAFAKAIDKGDIKTDIDLENFKTETIEFSEEALEYNRGLVSEHADKAEEWLKFAWWGL